MHDIAFSLLQRAIAASGEIKTRSEAHENDMTLTIAEEEALEEWYLHMHHWGYPTRLDLLRSIVEDRERRNVECASDFFYRMLDPLTAVIRRKSARSESRSHWKELVQTVFITTSSATGNVQSVP